jgi:hypothetical protein
MKDKAFERSLTALAALTLIWIIASIICAILGIPFISVGWAIFIGLLVLIFGGGALLYFWGKSYMARG